MTAAMQAIMGCYASTGGVSIDNQFITQSGGTIAGSAAGYRLNASGIAEARNASVYSTLETWLDAGAASDYDVRATLTSGTAPSGTVGSWLNLGTSREWSISTPGAGTTVCVLLIEIGLAGSGTAIDSATISLESERF